MLLITQLIFFPFTPLSSRVPVSTALFVSCVVGNSRESGLERRERTAGRGHSEEQPRHALGGSGGRDNVRGMHQS